MTYRKERYILPEITERIKSGKDGTRAVPVTTSRGGVRAIDFTPVIEGSGDGVIAFDSAWRVLYVNDTISRWAGKPASYYTGRIVWDEFPHLLNGPLEEPIRQAMQDRVTIAFEHYSSTYGRWFDVRYCPSPEGLFVHLRDISDRVREYREAEAARTEGQRRQREFLRDVLVSVTNGRFHFCPEEDALPGLFPMLISPIVLTAPSLYAFREAVRDACMLCGLPEQRAFELVIASGEAAMNTVVHAGGGVGMICGDMQGGTVQVWINDLGPGIAMETLPRATLESGYSSRGSLGQGFHLMLRTCDRLHLKTNTDGTTIVLEQDRECIASELS